MICLYDSDFWFSCSLVCSSTLLLLLAVCAHSSQIRGSTASYRHQTLPESSLPLISTKLQQNGVLHYGSPMNSQKDSHYKPLINQYWTQDQPSNYWKSNLLTIGKTNLKSITTNPLSIEYLLFILFYMTTQGWLHTGSLLTVAIHRPSGYNCGDYDLTWGTIGLTYKYPFIRA